MFSEEDGKILLKLARGAVERYLSGKKWSPEKTNFEEKKGVFVTITDLNGNLRGCIGYPYPTLPLGEAVQRAAVSAAFEDPRFPPISKDELKRIAFEVSVLTEPELIEVEKPEDYLKRIKLGKDGLIVERGFRSGLLLPQVATEHKMSEKNFLSHTCLKAGLPPNCWLDKETKIYKFQAKIFKESSKHT